MCATRDGNRVTRVFVHVRSPCPCTCLHVSCLCRWTQFVFVSVHVCMCAHSCPLCTRGPQRLLSPEAFLASSSRLVNGIPPHPFLNSHPSSHLWVDVAPGEPSVPSIAHLNLLKSFEALSKHRLLQEASPLSLPNSRHRCLQPQVQPHRAGSVSSSVPPSTTRRAGSG